MMDAQKGDRSKVWTPLLFSLVLICGMALGFNLRDTLRNKRDISTVIQRNDRLEEIIDLINDKYVDTINSNFLYKDAVTGILKSLDPHTVYIPADELQSVNDNLEGSFSGIGVEFSIVRDTIEITAVTENGPASKSGVATGDQLIKVGDSVVAGNGITSARITHLLKGKQKSEVTVTVKRLADGDLKQFSIVRDVIPLYSIDAGIMLDAVTGFIKINRFSATTYTEFKTALGRLKTQGASQLIIDLRDNPGGYLDAATSIADDLLDESKLIVYTKGIHTPKTEYRSVDKGLFEKGRVVILVDEGSASASEILAGAIQDWDRGVIIGRRSYGKGLVQEQYDMPDGAAVRLTVAKYYTPSGRCIQRSFAQGKEDYMDDYERRFESGELTGNDSVAPSDTMRFYTSRHRVVYGGGGIKPDIYVPYDTGKYSKEFFEMVLSDDLKTSIWDYFVQNRLKLNYKKMEEFTGTFDDEKSIVNSYVLKLSPTKKKAVLKQLSKRTAYDYFELQIKAQLARLLFNDNGYYAVSLKEDAVVKKALEVLKGDQYSAILKGIPGK